MNLNIGWLYPELMSTYGDRGNIMILKKRCEWRNIDVTVQHIDFKTTEKEVSACDLIVGGGAQDRQQQIVVSDLREKKGMVLKELFDTGLPGLFVCGAPQLLGHSYMTGDGTTLDGLGIFDMESKHFGKDKPRCIGNLLCEVTNEFVTHLGDVPRTIVGFENHGGRTYLGKGVRPFAKVVKGFGNNGEDSTEGARYNNCIATYSHGPFLSKNPHIADWLIRKALSKKTDRTIVLDSLDDSLTWKAHDVMIKRIMNE
jgi:hypothetical protein